MNCAYSSRHRELHNTSSLETISISYDISIIATELFITGNLCNEAKYYCGDFKVLLISLIYYKALFKTSSLDFRQMKRTNAVETSKMSFPLL